MRKVMTPIHAFFISSAFFFNSAFNELSLQMLLQCFFLLYKHDFIETCYIVYLCPCLRLGLLINIGLFN